MRIPAGNSADTVTGIERLVDPSVIRLVLTIANAGSFAAAAALLGISQPSVSQQVKRIEYAIGRPVFRRSRRGATLTVDGEAVVIYARAMRGLANDLRQRLDLLQDGAEVAVGMSEDFCRTGLLPVLRLFAIDHPRVRLRIESGNYDTLSTAIESRRVDFAVIRRFDRFPDAVLVFRDELVWYGGIGLRFPITDPVPIVVPLPPNPSRSTVIECLQAASRTFMIRFESVGIAGMEMALSANFGVCAGPRSMSLLQVAPLPDGHGLPPLPPVDFVMVRASAVLGDAARAFSEVLVEAARLRFKVAEDRKYQEFDAVARFF